jgi:hypothetical protein
MVMRDLKALGGPVSNAINCFIRCHFARARVVIRSPDIAEGVIHDFDR